MTGRPLALSVGQIYGTSKPAFFTYLMEEDDSRDGRFFFLYFFIYGKDSL
jgi:hypothetical protein